MKSVLDGWNPLSVVKFAKQVKFSYGKWSLSMTSEVSPKVKLRWESILSFSPLFVPQVRGSLDFARDDGAFSHWKKTRVLKMTFFWGEIVISTKWNAWRNPLRRSSGFVACWHTRRYKSLLGFSIYAKAFDMCYRTRYALKGVMVGKVDISLFSIVRTNH